MTSSSTTNGSLTGDELRDYLSPICSETTILLTGTCYGGGFAKSLTEPRYITISASGEDQQAYSTSKSSIQGFFIDSLLNPNLSDKNLDGRVSIAEAFDHARIRYLEYLNSIEKECTPQMSSERDPGEIFF